MVQKLQSVSAADAGNVGRTHEDAAAKLDDDVAITSARSSPEVIDISSQHDDHPRSTLQLTYRSPNDKHVNPLMHKVAKKVT